MEKSDRIQLIVVKDDLANYERFTVSKKVIVTVGTLFGVFLVFLSIFSIYAASKLLELSQSEGNLRDEISRLELELSQTKKENEELKETVAQLKQEKRETVEELAKRLEIINSLMKKVGLKVDTSEGKGGTAVPLSKILTEDDVDLDLSSLIPQVDRMIKEFKTVPIGYPTYGRITSPFGLRINPITGRAEFHLGVDIANRWGTPIRTPADGKVIRAGYCGLMGRCVEIDHGNGIETYYGHLSKILVHKGEKVKRGEIIGLMGSTGRSTGPHLHYAVKFRGKIENPKIFLEALKNVKEEKRGRNHRG